VFAAERMCSIACTLFVHSIVTWFAYTQVASAVVVHWSEAAYCICCA